MKRTVVYNLEDIRDEADIAEVEMLKDDSTKESDDKINAMLDAGF